MTLYQELREIEARLIQLIGKGSNEVMLLHVRLNCRNCKNATSVNKNDWECSLYGMIPTEYVSEGCESWIMNIARRN